MFREMRRKKQQLDREACLAVLRDHTAGVLSLWGDDGYPYGVPLSYVYADGKIFFHCAKEGHKIDALHRSSKASFCVIDRDAVVPQEYTTYFRSVIAFGRVRILEEPQEIKEAIEKLAVKYAPLDGEENRRLTVAQAWDRLCMLEFSIEHLTGKQAIEMVKKDL